MGVAVWGLGDFGKDAQRRASVLEHEQNQGVLVQDEAGDGAVQAKVREGGRREREREARWQQR